MRPLELLAPAKNLACGKAAIDHGADAVYIGAPRFGARAAAGNSVADIAELCRYAHLFGARVYVTVNTLFDNQAELDAATSLMEQLHEVGTDAFLVQDMRLLALADKYVLHASTQTDNRRADKVEALWQAGCERVVLARELTLQEISAIHQQVPSVELEAFVHGAICVSYSGICFASEHCFHRSANRGECAQFCRMKFDLLDADGNEIIHQRHLLSLKDMCRIDQLEALADAGVTSFKIEGRLKDEDYVKNVVTAYRRALDEMIHQRRNDYCRASYGQSEQTFKPNLEKTFNRGYTDYFLQGNAAEMESFYTPKMVGEYVGRVKEIRGRSVVVATSVALANGDGLSFFDDNHDLSGFRVNRVEGNRLLLHTLPAGLKKGTAIFRNHDEAFVKMLSHPTATRKLELKLYYEAVENGFRLTGCTEYGAQATAFVEAEHQLARTDQGSHIQQQLRKTGDTPFKCTVTLMGSSGKWFLPISQVVAMRNKVVGELLQTLPMKPLQPAAHDVPKTSKLHLENVRYAPKKPLMQCRFCLRRALGWCEKNGGKRPDVRLPLYLRLGDGRRFRLEFQCNICQMNVYAEDE